MMAPNSIVLPPWEVAVRKSKGTVPPEAGKAGHGLDLEGSDDLARVRVVPSGDESEDFEVVSTEPSAWTLNPAMYSDELLFSPPKVPFRKPVAVVHSVPVRRDNSLKLSARKLLDAMPLAVQLDLRARGEAERLDLIRKIREDRAAPLFEIRTKELGRLAGITVTNLDRIHEMLAELVGVAFKWNVLGEQGDVQYEAVTAFLIRRDKGVGRKLGYTRFAFEPEVLLWFLDPQMWASLSWTVIKGIGGSSGPGQEAAFGLYQNTWRYINTHAKQTPSLPVATWIDLILGPSRFVKVGEDGVTTVSDYKDFKRRYLVPALAIINAHPALNHTIEHTEEKSGHKVLRLRFKFVEKVQAAFEFPLGWPPETFQQLKQLGYSDKDITTLSQLYLFNQVQEALKRFPAAEQRAAKSGTKFYSRKAYFNGILVNVAKGQKQTAEEEEKLLQEAIQLERKEQETQRMAALQEKFATHQRALLSHELNQLREEERQKLFAEHLSARPEDKLMFKSDRLSASYLVLFCNWFVVAKPDLALTWLPEPKDQNLQSWLGWKLMSE